MKQVFERCTCKGERECPICRGKGVVPTEIYVRTDILINPGDIFGKGGKRWGEKGELK